MKKLLGFILISIVIIVPTVILAKNAIIKSSIESIVSMSTGLKMNIGKLDVSMLKTSISIKDMEVLNPSDFNDKTMLYMPEIYIDYNLPELLAKKIHLSEMRLDLKELTIVKNQDGSTNLDNISSLKQKDSKQPELQIDNLSLKIGKVTYKDYSAGKAPMVLEYNINIDSHYKNIKNVGDLIKLIVAKSLTNTSIGNLSDFKKFKDLPADTVEIGKNLLKGTAKELKDIIKIPLDKIKAPK